jgi:hypothetical protein
MRLAKNSCMTFTGRFSHRSEVGGGPGKRGQDGFYKRECQEKVFSPRRRGGVVLDIQPLSPGSMLVAAHLSGARDVKVTVQTINRG